MPIYGITPKLPLSTSTSDGKYTMIKDYKSAVKQNFKNLVLTNPGERMMDIEFGVGIHRYLFEMRHDAIALIREEIEHQIEKYVPYISLLDIQFPEVEESIHSEETLIVHIIYEVLPLSTIDILELNITR